MFLTAQISHLTFIQLIMCFTAEDQTEGKKSLKYARSEDGSNRGLAEDVCELLISIIYWMEMITTKY